MFRIICLKCYQHIDIKAFHEGQVSACPNCGTGAFAYEQPLPDDTKTDDQKTEEKRPFICPKCKRTLLVPISVVGKEKICPGCKSKIRILLPDEPEPPIPPANNATEKIAISFPDIPQTNSISRNVPPSVPPQYRTEFVRTSLPVAAAFDYPKPPEGVKLPPRQRRLYSDVKLVVESLAGSPYIKIQNFEGTPPDLYHIEYHVRGIESVRGNNIIYRDIHNVEIRLTADYPRQAPVCQLLTPIFHPNFAPSHICIGDHWTAGERLIDLIVRIGEMITYQSYNIKSPLDGEAAMWADLNNNIFPTDNCDLIPLSYQT
ncbi:MAG: hypothetical protein LBQ50_03075 [Planctomycetaceae bacterium]|jgi:ubiquitin-protein ligase/DNA-directed RNA polymerase subunit RPC12/RpoP|nr:hypothetical protein [Planctomycetaceae bacterium]